MAAKSAGRLERPGRQRSGVADPGGVPGAQGPGGRLRRAGAAPVLRRKKAGLAGIFPLWAGILNLSDEIATEEGITLGKRTFPPGHCGGFPGPAYIRAGNFHRAQRRGSGHRRGVAFGHADLIPLLFSYHFSPHLGADGVSRSALLFCPGAVSYGWEAGKPALPSADRKAPCGKCRISFISIIMYEAGNPLSKFSQFPVANFFCV